MQVKRKTDDYLAHHGVKGQRWGIRRYQNADGTLTEAGKKKYNKFQTVETKKLDKREEKLDTKTLSKAQKLESKAESIKEKYGEDSKKTKKAEEARDRVINNYNVGKTILEKERTAISSYKLSDYMSENNKAKRAKASYYTTTILTSAAVNMALAPLTGYAVWVLPTQGKKVEQNSRTSTRLKYLNEDQKKN